MKNELYAGLLLFLISFASIQICSDLIKSCYDINNSNLILPVLLFSLPLIAGVLTMLSGILFNIPYAILPNLIITILIAVYGRTYFGYSLLNALVSAFFGCLFYIIFTFWIKDKNWKDWIPKPLTNVFPFVLGCIFIFFGLFRSGMLNSANSPEAATTIGSTLPQIQILLPVYLGYLLNPISILVLLGIALYLFFQKKYPHHIVLYVFLLISIVGFFIPIVRGSLVKGHISAFQAFGPISLRKDGFSLLFNGNLVSSQGITIETWTTFFRIIFKQSTGLLKLSFIIFISLFFQNFFVLNSLENLVNAKPKTPLNPDKKSQQESTIVRPSPSNAKLTKFNSITSIFGLFFNTTAFSYAQESAVLSLTEAKTGLTAFFCGLLLLLTAFLSPLGIFTFQAGTPLLFILVGIIICVSQIKNLTTEKIIDWVPFLLFLLISIITMNPIEGIVVAILFYGLITIYSILFGEMESRKVPKMFWVTFCISILYLICQIKIEI